VAVPAPDRSVGFGLTAFGAALGDCVPVAEVAGQYTANLDRVLGYGVHNVHRAKDNTGLTDLALDASAEALGQAGITADELDLVVLAITDVAEYLYWDPAAHLQHRLGARNAEAVLLAQACTGGLMSFDVVAGKFATHPDYRTALIVAANRTCEKYWNRMETQPRLFSDGAAAAVAVRDHPGWRWRTTEVRTDGDFAGLSALPAGGTAMPFTAEPPLSETALRARDAWDVLDFFDYDEQRFTHFLRSLDERVRSVVERACARIGTTTAEIAHYVLVHDNKQAMLSLATELGTTLDRTNLDTAMEHGHLGAADHLFTLATHATNRHQSNDLIALAGRGSGMHWACTLLTV
jgi:3-oxoacyl-[acyl-carrier-protein] synthase-3